MTAMIVVAEQQGFFKKSVRINSIGIVALTAEFIIQGMSSKIQAEIKTYTSNQAICRKFMNFYRCSKSISLLNTLYDSRAINKSVYGEEVKEVQDIYNNLKEQLKEYDLKRFCELWEIDYHQKIEVEGEDIAIPIKIASHVPGINDAIDTAKTYGEVYEALANFCKLIKTLRSKKVTPALQTVIDDLSKKQRDMHDKYKNFEDLYTQRDYLKELLTKFRVEFQRIYNI